MKLNRGSMNRAVIYFFYDGEGVVDRYVSYMLKDLKTCARDIYVVTNGSLTPEGRKTFLEFTDCVWERGKQGTGCGSLQARAEYDRLGQAQGIRRSGPDEPYDHGACLSAQGNV